MGGASQRDARSVVERFVQAINGHDLEAIVGCFAQDYQDVEPVHPARQITGGRDEVLVVSHTGFDVGLQQASHYAFT